VLASPRFHHLRLNSVDPDAAIDFYTAQFSTTSRSTWGGLPAVASPNDVLILFTQVVTPPATSTQTAIWHFGWHSPWRSSQDLPRFDESFPCPAADGI
jgi:catechol 2,3-dioxygenase-like lactoylglutathione lyase family enzyme